MIIICRLLIIIIMIIICRLLIIIIMIIICRLLIIIMIIICRLLIIIMIIICRLEWPDLAQLVLQCLKSLHALCSPSDFESPPEGEDIALEEHLLEDPQGVKFTHEGVLGPCLSLLTQLCAEYPPVGEKIGPYVRTGMLEDFDDIIAKSSRECHLV